MQRGQKGWVNWARIGRIAARWLPSTRSQHPWPQVVSLVVV
jgi:hypothetical protein